jgi:hypothetical protein
VNEGGLEDLLDARGSFGDDLDEADGWSISLPCELIPGYVDD